MWAFVVVVVVVVVGVRGSLARYLKVVLLLNLGDTDSDCIWGCAFVRS